MHQFEMSIDLRPDNAWVYFNRAQANENSGQFTEALGDYKKSLQLTKPKLPTYKRKHAESRVTELTGE